MGKATAGRKKKQGVTREPNGRISRSDPSNRDKGTQRAQDTQSVFGRYGMSAISRAFAMGLLGEDGQRLHDIGGLIHRAYWPMLGNGMVRCPLGGHTGRSSTVVTDYTQEELVAREKRLTADLATINKMGRNYRRAFDELVIDINPDSGPVWLDRLIAGKGSNMDHVTLGMALTALREVV